MGQIIKLLYDAATVRDLIIREDAMQHSKINQCLHRPQATDNASC